MLESNQRGPKKNSIIKGESFLSELPCSLFNNSNQSIRKKDIGLEKNIGKGASTVRNHIIL